MLGSQPSHRSALLDELRVVREQGYATNMEERIAGMRAVGAPIRDSDGDAIAAISLSAPTTRLQGEQLERVIPEKILQTARVIELRTTYSSDCINYNVMFVMPFQRLFTPQKTVERIASRIDEV
ncbi:hypothetical protein HUB97_13875 [Halorubraceae archaeon YAN]|nr:hypothetical protein [Halorubraceae archaeon YAN]